MFTVLVLIAVMGFAADVSAGLISSTGPVVVLDSPPPSADKGALRSGPSAGSEYPEFTAFYFDETASVQLAEDLEVSVVESGFYAMKADLPSLFPNIQAGLVVSSHLLHLDRRIDPTLEGTLTFDTDILGVIVHEGNRPHPELDLLSGSDALLGWAGTFYPDDRAQRGLEFAAAPAHPKDAVGISEDRRTLTWRLQSGSGAFDQIRIVTGCCGPTPTPEPSAVVLFMAGLSLLGLGKAFRSKKG